MAFLKDIEVSLKTWNSFLRWLNMSDIIEFIKSYAFKEHNKINLIEDVRARTCQEDQLHRVPEGRIS